MADTTNASTARDHRLTPRFTEEELAAIRAAADAAQMTLTGFCALAALSVARRQHGQTTPRRDAGSRRCRDGPATGTVGGTLPDRASAEELAEMQREFSAARVAVNRTGTNLNQAVAQLNATGTAPVWLEHAMARVAKSPGRRGRAILYPVDVDYCNECGFRYATVSAEELPRRLEAAGPRFVAALSTIHRPRRRPAPSTWSPLEYTCHVRDVLRVQCERVVLALQVDNPEFVPMGREERVVLDAYNAQDPQTVLAELAEAANDLARIFDALSPLQWSRTGVYNWPTVESRTMLWLGRHTIHELEHHLMDLTR